MTENKPEARPGSLEPAIDASITWRYLAPAGVTLEMCQAPDYWGNCVRELAQQRVFGRNSWNKIEIIAEDGTWEAELRVLSVKDNLVHTRLLREWSEPAKAGRKAGMPQGYTVEHVPENGWRAIDPKGNILIEKQTVEDDAIKAARDHAKKFAGNKAA
jgi:hypothetical protein